MVSSFRIVSYLEGISYLLLLFVAVPLKYFGNNEILVKTLGMPHGLLFIAYLLLSFYIKPDFKWGRKDFFIILFASVIPFGTFYVDKKYFLKKKIQIKSAKRSAN
jgi:integral membrane protein